MLDAIVIKSLLCIFKFGFTVALLSGINGIKAIV